VDFIRKVVQGSLPVSASAIQKTKGLLFIEELSDGKKLFGKTGSGLLEKSEGIYELGWFVGWVEMDARFFPFAYTICDEKIDPSRRIPRVKQLLKEVLIYKKL
jgi:beta-lactamase class D